MKTMTNIDQQIKLERLEIELEQVYERFKADSGKRLEGRLLMSGMIVVSVVIFGAIGLMM